MIVSLRFGDKKKNPLFIVSHLSHSVLEMSRRNLDLKCFIRISGWLTKGFFLSL